MSDIFILAPDPTGTCCDCSARMSVCDPCTANSCSCAIILPVGYPGNQAYDTAILAQEAIDNYSADCLAVSQTIFGGNVILTTFTADNSTPNQLVLTATLEDDPGFDIEMAVSLNLKGGSILTIGYSASSPEGTDTLYALYTCDGIFVSEDETLSDTGSFSVPITDDNEYILYLITSSQSTSNFVSVTFTITSTNLNVNPVIALYVNPSDPDNPLELEACPKLFIPPLTESTDTVYANETDAQNAIDTFVFGCLFYSLLTGADFSTSASGGSGASITTTNTIPDGSSTGLAGWLSINAEVGETISLTWSASGGSGLDCSANIGVYDYTGTSLFSADTIGGTSGTAVTAALPYTGRYIIFISIQDEESTGPILLTGATADVTSSGIMSVNSVTALYANGSNCPSRLDCTP